MRKTAAALVAVLGLAACGGSEEVTPQAEPTNPGMRQAIVGTWHPVAIAGYLPDAQDQSVAEATISFAEDGSWEGSDGCNGMNGTYEVTPEGTFSAQGPGGMTKIGCANVPNAQVLEGATDVRIENRLLVLETVDASQRRALGYYSAAFDENPPVPVAPSPTVTGYPPAATEQDCAVPETADPRGTNPDLTGLALTDVQKLAKEHHHKLRVLGEDGECASRTDDLDYRRINVYLEDGTVAWASMF